MSHPPTPQSFKLSWALALGLAASTLLQGTAAAEPATTTEPATATEPATTTNATSPAVEVTVDPDLWHLYPEPESTASEISAQARDRWYLEDSAPAFMQARSHRSQEEEVHIY